MQQLYTTPEAAKATGIPEGTIRAWLSRHAQIFQPEHLVIDDSGKKLWTDQGIELLQSRRATENAASFTANSDAGAIEGAYNAANSDAGGKPFHDAIVDGFADRVARELAATVCQRLPGQTLHHIHRILNSPLPQEKEKLHQSMQQAMHLLPRPGKRDALPSALEAQ